MGMQHTRRCQRERTGLLKQWKPRPSGSTVLAALMGLALPWYALSAQAGPHCSAVPASPPDSLPIEYQTLSDTMSGGNHWAGVMLRQIVVVQFRRGTAQPLKQAAICSVRGVVVGGRPLGREDGIYLVRVPTDSTGELLWRAIGELRKLPSVAIAMPEEVLSNLTGDVSSYKTPPRDSFVVRVRSDAGRPVADALVDIPATAGTSNVRGRTDANGRAVLVRAGQHTARLRVRRIGYTETVVVVDPDTSRTGIEIVVKEHPIRLEGLCTLSWDPAVVLVADTVFAQDTTWVRMRVSDGAYEDVRTIRLRDWREVGFAGERAGRYDIEVRAHGYRIWRRSGVRVTKGICHVQARTFRVRLSPMP